LPDFGQFPDRKPPKVGQIGDPDEEALSWAGDEDRGRARPELSRPSTEAEVEPDTGAPSEPPRGGARVLPVVFALPYLALTIGWVLGVQRTSSGTTELLTEILWQFGEFLAIVAAPLWFLTTTTQAHRIATRLGWFALGLGVLVPWPLVLGVLTAVAA
jgi:hypothetical protein